MSKVSMLDEKAHKCEWKETTDECVRLVDGHLYLFFLLVASCFIYGNMYVILSSYFFFC
jgi:hypothetical protein